MFTRFVSMTLKPNAGQEFTNALERQILPILRSQRGFRDEMIFVEPGSPELLAVSLWDSKEDAEKYGKAVYPELLNVLAPVARPGFQVNHTLMMKHGQAGLRTYMAGYGRGAQAQAEEPAGDPAT